MGNVENTERSQQSIPGIPSDYPVSNGPHVEHQNRFFQEYQMKCMQDMDFARRETKNWQDVQWSIVDMKIEDQAKYADYVTRKTAALGEEILVAMAEESIKSAEYCTKKMKLTGACVIGNEAHIIVSLGQYPNQHDLKERLEKAHRDYLSFVNMFRLGDMMIKSGVMAPNQPAAGAAK